MSSNYSPTHVAIEKHIIDLLDRLKLTNTSKPLLVGVSGGPDSMALLLALDSIKAKCSIELHVAHLNHGLRGIESDEDAVFVQDISKELALPVTVERVELDYYKSLNGMSLEEAAREVRYNFLYRVANMMNASAVILGHTANDQVETVMMNIIRGTSLTGLTGMSQISSWRPIDTVKPIKVVRPILTFLKKHTLEYCAYKGIEPRLDSSNTDKHFTRNRIRSELLPNLRSYNPRFDSALLRLSTLSEQNHSYIMESAIKTKESITSIQDGVTYVEKNQFLKLHPAMQTNILRLMYEEHAGSLKSLGSRHVQAMLNLSESIQKKELYIPNGLIFKNERGLLSIGYPISEYPDIPIIKGEHNLAVPGTLKIPGLEINASLSPIRSNTNKSHSFTAQLDRNQIGEQLLIRTRRPGDRFYPLGITGSKKLKDFMIDQKIPRNFRDRLPIVLSDDRIAWVIGFRIAQWAKQEETTANTLFLECHKSNAI